MEIANKCPVHKTLYSEVVVETKELGTEGKEGKEGKKD
jgi:hypothetical protein